MHIMFQIIDSDANNSLLFFFFIFQIINANFLQGEEHFNEWYESCSDP